MGLPASPISLLIADKLSLEKLKLLGVTLWNVTALLLSTLETLTLGVTFVSEGAFLFFAAGGFRFATGGCNSGASASSSVRVAAAVGIGFRSAREVALLVALLILCCLTVDQRHSLQTEVLANKLLLAIILEH